MLLRSIMLDKRGVPWLVGMTIDTAVSICLGVVICLERETFRPGCRLLLDRLAFSD
jgi:hypothetical protein